MLVGLVAREDDDLARYSHFPRQEASHENLAQRSYSTRYEYPFVFQYRLPESALLFRTKVGDKIAHRWAIPRIIPRSWKPNPARASRLPGKTALRSGCGRRQSPLPVRL